MVCKITPNALPLCVVADYMYKFSTKHKCKIELQTLKLPPYLPLRKMAVIGSASSNFKIMWSLKPTNKKPIEVKQIVFDNVAGIFDYPKNIRIPNVGEYVWFSIWKQGTVLSVENKLEDGFFVTTIRVGERQ